MKIFFTFLVALFLFSCGAGVGLDYDKNTNFSQYTTYNYYPEIDSGLNELDDKRIIRITDSLLTLRGFTKSDDPQLYINFFAGESVSNSRNTLGIGIGGGGGNVGVGVSGGIPIGGRVINQLLTVDFIDVAKDDLIWQAKLEGEYKEKASPRQKQLHYTRSLEKILSEYPPKN